MSNNVYNNKGRKSLIYAANILGMGSVWKTGEYKIR